ncbi:MAG: HAD-IA family hydrolase [Bacteroidota bacterium]|nr:HAD-IA family hydrolase [Bacteroidota bacterium]
MAVQLVVFDIAGTTVSDKGNITQAFIDAFLMAGIKVEAGDVNRLMGYRKIDAIRKIIQHYAPELGDDADLIHEIHNKFTSQMVSFYEQDTMLAPLPYAELIFEKLQKRGIKIGLDTGFTRPITNAVLRNIGWDQSGLIDCVVCSDEVPEGRPHPFMIQQIMQQTGVADPVAVIKVGDTEVDINEGRNAGCGAVVAVTTGAFSKEELVPYHPDFIIDSLYELLPIIDRF